MSRTYAQLGSAGVAADTVERTWASQWCLTRLSPSGGMQLATSSTADADFTALSLFYDEEARHYYAVAEYSWHDMQYRDDQMPIWCGVNQAVGAPDGFGVRIGSDVAYDDVHGSAAVWGNPFLDSASNDYGFVQLSPDVNAERDLDAHGVFYRFQDNVLAMSHDGWIGCGDPDGVDYDMYGGVVIFGFDYLAGSCHYAQPFAEYLHTWDDSSITGVSIGPWSFGLQWEHHEVSFDATPANIPPSTQICPQPAGSGWADVLPSGGGSEGGPVSMAEPAMAYDLGDGTMKIYRWFSTGTAFGRLPDYQSGTFRLSHVGDRVAAGDVDGDGDSDIVMAYQLDNGTFAFYVFKNGITSAGQWYVSGTFPLGNVGGRLIVGDFNGDGKAEPALVYDNGDGTMTIYRWLSTGTSFTRTTDYHSGTFRLSHVGNRVASGDVTGDGKADIVMAYQNDNGTFGYHVFSTGATYSGIWYTSGTFNLGNVGGRLVVADFSGDGKSEPAMAYDNGDGTMTIYRWLSTGTSFTRTTDYHSGTFRLSHVGDRVAAGEVSGDSKADIVMAYQLDDGTFAYYVFKNGLTSDGQWYVSGQYPLSNVGGRLVVGRW